MSTTTGIPIGQLPVLGAVTDDSYVVGEHAGSGLFSALALRSYGAGGNVGRNLLHNPLFNVAQRGTSFSANGYTLDRWQLAFVSDTGVAVVQTALSDSARSSIGDEAAVYCLQLTTTGNAAAGAFTEIIHSIEGVRRLSAKTVTLSFWATASVNGLKLGINAVQNFGTGGSPSGAIGIMTTGLSVTLSTAWARYSVTFAVPSTSGKTLGTNNNDSTQLQLWLSAGASYNATAGNIGVQSGTVQLWGVQLEVGAQATPLDYGGSPADQLHQCQRYYYAGNINWIGYQGAGSLLHWLQSVPVPMRAVPTLTPTFTTQTNCSGSTLSAADAYNFVVNTSATALGAVTLIGTYTASADL